MIKKRENNFGTWIENCNRIPITYLHLQVMEFIRFVNIIFFITYLHCIIEHENNILAMRQAFCLKGHELVRLRSKYKETSKHFKFLYNVHVNAFFCLKSN